TEQSQHRQGGRSRVQQAVPDEAWSESVLVEELSSLDSVEELPAVTHERLVELTPRVGNRGGASRRSIRDLRTARPQLVLRDPLDGDAALLELPDGRSSFSPCEVGHPGGQAPDDQDEERSDRLDGAAEEHAEVGHDEGE